MHKGYATCSIPGSFPIRRRPHNPNSLCANTPELTLYSKLWRRSQEPRRSSAKNSHTCVCRAPDLTPLGMLCVACLRHEHWIGSWRDRYASALNVLCCLPQKCPKGVNAAYHENHRYQFCSLQPTRLHATNGASAKTLCQIFVGSVNVVTVCRWLRGLGSSYKTCRNKGTKTTACPLTYAQGTPF